MTFDTPSVATPSRSFCATTVTDQCVQSTECTVGMYGVGRSGRLRQTSRKDLAVAGEMIRDSALF